MALSNTEEIVENSIFLAIEKILTEEGYLPDMDQYNFGDPDPLIAKAAQELYELHIKQIVTNKGFAIELFNYENAQDRGVKKAPRIVVETMGFFSGRIGKDSTAKYILGQNNKFTKEHDGQKTSDMYVNLNLVANDVKQIRILHAICSAAIPRRGYIPRFISLADELELKPDGNLFIEYIDYNDSSDYSQGIIEKVYRYMIPDVAENIPKIDNTEISKITDIDLDVNTDQ